VSAPDQRRTSASGPLRTFGEFAYRRPSVNRGGDMDIQEQIERYITCQPEPKRGDMQALHRVILQLTPECKLWFLDGKNSDNKTISNPNIGYGLQTIRYADGKTREFYQIGLSANTTGISVYIIGIEDKKYLSRTYGKELGKATLSGYCVKFRAIKDINIDVLVTMLRYGIEATGSN